MKKILFSLLLSSVGLVQAAAPLGVLYEPTTSVISPDGLKITNLTILGATASKVTAFSAASKLVNTLLDSSKADILQNWVGGANTLNLGLAQIIGGTGTPTNGTAYVQRILYINSTGTNLNDTYWGNYGTNWYAIASTNGGTIIENQINFSDNTTGDATTLKHGFMPKLSGLTNDYLAGDGLWRNPLVTTVSNGYHLTASGGVGPGSTGVSQSRLNESLGTLTFDGAAFTPGEFRIHSIFNTNTITTGNLLVTGFTDVTTGDVSITAHGLTPKAPNDSSKFLNGLGAWSVPAGGGGGGVAVTGSPDATQLSYFTGTNSISGMPSTSYSAILGLTVPTIRLSNSLYINPDTTEGNVRSGSYTPTVVGYYLGSNSSGATQVPCYYFRIGSLVHVSGRIQFNKTSTRLVEFAVDLPITTTAPSRQHLSGNFGLETSAGLAQGVGGVITGQASPVSAIFYIDTGSTAGGLFNAVFNFTYVIQ